MSEEKAWYLITDYKNEPHPKKKFTSIQIENVNDIDDLKKKFITNSKLNVPANELVVWRCTDPNANFDDTDLEVLKVQVSNTFNLKKVKKLASMTKIAALELFKDAKSEIFFLQMLSALLDSFLLLLFSKY